jgi:hypothetical protein
MRLFPRSCALSFVFVCLSACGGKEEPPATVAAEPAARPAPPAQTAPAEPAASPEQTAPAPAPAEAAPATRPAEATPATRPAEAAPPATPKPAAPATVPKEPAAPATATAAPPAASPAVTAPAPVAPAPASPAETAAASLPERRQPEGKIVLPAKTGAVTFDHKRHAEKAPDCATCHHESRPEKPLVAKQQACRECHTPQATPPMMTSLRNAFHDGKAAAGICVDCHRKAANTTPPAPAKCADCHKKDT